MKRNDPCSLVALAGMLLLAAPVLPAQTHHASPSRVSVGGGRVRVHYIAADEVDWTYIPARGDQALTGKKDDFTAEAATRGMLDPNSSTYRKALFREYTDSSFRTLLPRDDAYAHMGLLGPLLRAEVGDTIRVVFRNHATRPYSMHPHGVFNRKAPGGTASREGTSGADRMDDSVPPGRTHVYTWLVP